MYGELVATTFATDAAREARRGRPASLSTRACYRAMNRGDKKRGVGIRETGVALGPPKAKDSWNVAILTQALEHSSFFWYAQPLVSLFW